MAWSDAAREASAQARHRGMNYGKPIRHPLSAISHAAHEMLRHVVGPSRPSDYGMPNDAPHGVPAASGHMYNIGAKYKADRGWTP